MPELNQINEKSESLVPEYFREAFIRIQEEFSKLSPANCENTEQPKPVWYGKRHNQS